MENIPQLAREIINLLEGVKVLELLDKLDKDQLILLNAIIEIKIKNMK